MRRGIDTGGAFTDFVYLGNGAGRVHQAPSTSPGTPLRPSSPSQARQRQGLLKMSDFKAA